MANGGVPRRARWVVLLLVFALILSTLVFVVALLLGAMWVKPLLAISPLLNAAALRSHSVHLRLHVVAASLVVLLVWIVGVWVASGLADTFYFDLQLVALVGAGVLLRRQSALPSMDQ